MDKNSCLYESGNVRIDVNTDLGDEYILSVANSNFTIPREVLKDILRNNLDYCERRLETLDLNINCESRMAEISIGKIYDSFLGAQREEEKRFQEYFKEQGSRD